MNKILVIIIILAVILVGGWYLFNSQQSPTGAMYGTDTSSQTTATTQSSDSGTHAPSPAPSGKGSGSLADIYSRGGNYTCSFETLAGAVHTKGNVYVASGKTRSDLSTTVSVVTTEVHTIIANSYNYTWVGGKQTGTKTYVGGNSKPAANNTGAGFDGDTSAQISWDCHPWLPNASYFALPKEISFVAQ